jgi:hypothetical protein
VPDAEDAAFLVHLVVITGLFGAVLAVNIHQMSIPENPDPASRRAMGGLYCF